MATTWERAGYFFYFTSRNDSREGHTQHRKHTPYKKFCEKKEEQKRQHAHPSTMPYIPNSQTNFAFPGPDAEEIAKTQALFVSVNTTV